MFRCGATYQDKPCESEVQKSFSAASGSFSQEQVHARTDASCAKAGLEAERLAKLRDAGTARDTLFAEIDARKIPRLEREKEKETVADAYRRQGAPLKVRSDTESDCMDRKRSALQATRSRPGTVQRGYPDSYEAARAEAEWRRADALAEAAAQRADAMSRTRRHAP